MSRPATHRALSATSAAALGAALTLSPVASAMAAESTPEPTAAAPAVTAPVAPEAPAAPVMPTARVKPAAPTTQAPQAPAAPVAEPSAAAAGAGDSGQEAPGAAERPVPSVPAGNDDDASQGGTSHDGATGNGAAGETTPVPSEGAGSESGGESGGEASDGGATGATDAGQEPSGDDAEAGEAPETGSVPGEDATTGADGAAPQGDENQAGSGNAGGAGVSGDASIPSEAGAADGSDGTIGSDDTTGAGDEAPDATVPGADATQPPLTIDVPQPATLARMEATSALAAAPVRPAFEELIEPKLRKEYLDDLKERFPTASAEHLDSLSDEDLLNLADLELAISKISSEEEAASFFLSDDALDYLDLIFGTDTTDDYLAALSRYLDGGSRADLAAWYKKTFGTDDRVAQEFARAVGGLLDAEAEQGKPTQPTRPTKPKPAKPAGVFTPANPAPKPVSKSAAKPAQPVAQPAPELAQTGMDGFGVAGLGVLALLAGGLATVASRRVRH